MSVRTFIDHPEYLGLRDIVYPKVRELCEEIIEGEYAEGIEVAGIGSGKSFSSEILACYATMHLLCLKNPHSYYKLAPDKDITIMNMGINATQANEVVFAGIRSFIERSPFFKKFNPKILQDTIHFEKEKILLVSGNSKSTNPIGYNIFYAILDEAAFYTDNDNRNVAEEIYTALQRRIVSRFGKAGLLMIISSPRYVDDFIMRKLRESYNNPRIFGVQLPTWKVKREDALDLKGRFYFNQTTGQILDELDETVDPAGVSYIQDRIFNLQNEWWEVPGEFRTSFQQNPEKSKRDFGAVPSKSLEGFFPNADVVKKIFKEDRKNPVKFDGTYSLPKPQLNTPYYVHLDLALNKNGKGDHAGLAMAHFDGWYFNPRTKEKRKKVYVDLVKRYDADPVTHEIDFEKIRQEIYTLKSIGYNVVFVSADSFQSADMQQILRKKGIRSELLSVDRTMEQYDNLKELVNDEGDRLSVHQQPKLFEELCSLEIVRGTKVDHPPQGSKDLADAMCGAVWNVVRFTKAGDMGMVIGSPSFILPPGYMTPGKPTFESVAQKIEYYRKLQERQDRGDFL